VASGSAAEGIGRQKSVRSVEGAESETEYSVGSDAMRFVDEEVKNE